MQLLNYLDMNSNLFIAANGHVTLDFGDHENVLYQKACAQLEKLGFTRRGTTLHGLDEGIKPSFFRAELEILTGYDRWSGSYFLATSGEGDVILHHLYADLLRSL